MTPETLILRSLTVDALVPIKTILKYARESRNRGRQAITVLEALGLIERIAYRSAFLYRRTVTPTERRAC